MVRRRTQSVTASVAERYRLPERLARPCVEDFVDRDTIRECVEQGAPWYAQYLAMCAHVDAMDAALEHLPRDIADELRASVEYPPRWRKPPADAEDETAGGIADMSALSTD